MLAYSFEWQQNYDEDDDGNHNWAYYYFPNSIDYQDWYNTPFAIEVAVQESERQ